jgi:hypothetical protein
MLIQNAYGRAIGASAAWNQYGDDVLVYKSWIASETIKLDSHVHMQTGIPAFHDTFDYFTGYILTIIREYL